jgi:hypothetical protein
MTSASFSRGAPEQAPGVAKGMGVLSNELQDDIVVADDMFGS